MNNKGFTLVELITTFALTAVIIIILLNIVVSIKKVYNNTSIKTELYINQSNLSYALNSKLNKNMPFNHQCRENYEDKLIACVFTFNQNQEDVELIVTEKQIKFGNYTYNLDEKTVVESATKEIRSYPDFRILNIKIVIRNELYPDIDFGVNFVYDM